MNNCLSCEKETKNPKFCSKACSAKLNNVLFPKRKLNRKCSKCDEQVKSYRHRLCENHFQELKEGKYKDRTLEEYRNMLSVKGKHPSWLNSHVRSFARSWNKELTKLPCATCGYDKHVELAHIKAVSDFTLDTKLRIVNSSENIIPLCRNCHWEFDNLEERP